MVGAVSRGRPWLGVTYVRAVLSGSDLWVKCTSSAELKIHSNGRVLDIIHHCHILSIMASLILLSPPCLVRWDLLSTFVLTDLLLCF
jgi:hypothetical protein